MMSRASIHFTLAPLLAILGSTGRVIPHRPANKSIKTSSCDFQPKLLQSPPNGDPLVE
jgi:hypothetical protein